MEAYYQICNKETTFDELALTDRKIKCHNSKRYNQLSPDLQNRLRGANTNKPQMPVRVKHGFLMTQVVEQLPAVLDNSLSKQLLNELENKWAVSQLKLRLEEIDLPESLTLSEETTIQ